MKSRRRLVTRARPTSRKTIPFMSKHAILPAALTLCALLTPAQAAPAEDKEEKPDILLVRSVQAIREAFQAERAALLRPLLSGGGKVFLAVKVVASDSGYYSPDQIEVMFAQTFARIQTTQFRLRVPPGKPSGGEARVVLCPAAWVYTAHGERKETQLQFVLARHEESWKLNEIREIR